MVLLGMLSTGAATVKLEGTEVHAFAVLSTDFHTFYVERFQYVFLNENMLKFCDDYLVNCFTES